MAYTLNRRLAELVASNGQLNAGKIPDNEITQAKLHSSFTVTASHLGTSLTPTFGNTTVGSRLTFSSNSHYLETGTNAVAIKSSGGTVYLNATNAGTTINNGLTVNSNITTTGYLAGPSTFTIDPAAVGDNTGTVVIAGNLQVDGTTTTINSTTLDVDDLNITIAKGITSSTGANGAGITIEGPTNNATMTWDHANQYLEFNKDIFANAHIIGTTATKVGRIINASGVFNVEAYSNRSISFGNVDNGEHVRIDANGNVGIGTTSPNTALTIVGDITVTKTAAGSNILSLKRNGAANAWKLAQGHTATDYFEILEGNDARLTIKNGGNVGIGTTSPDSELQILNNDGSSYRFGYGGSSDVYLDADNVYIRTDNGGANTATFITSGLGIGTTTPNQWASYTDSAATVLQVRDTSQRARLIINGGNGAHLDLVDYAGGSNDKHMNIAVDAGKLKFGALNDAGSAFVKDNIMILDMGSGYVAIGESTPDTILHVKGTGSGGHGTIKMEGESAHLGFTRADGNFRSWVGHYNSSGHGSDTDLNIKTGYVAGSSSTGNIRITADGDTTAAQVYLQGSTGNLSVGAGTSPAERLTIGGGIGTNANTAFASMGGRLGFGNDYSDTQRGPNKIVLQNDGAWIAGLGISDNSVDLYSGGKFTFLDSASASSYATRMVIDSNGKVGINASSPGSTFSVGHTAAHSNNRITIFSDDYNYGQIRVGSSTSEASIGFMRSTTQANTDNNSPSGGNNTWAIGLGVWGANFGIGSNAILDNVVEWDSSGHMLPGTNNTYDLGSTSRGWRNIYTNDLNLSNMPAEGKDSNGDDYTREGNEVDGTNGSWTIQEGEDDLFLINRRNGKKYKFNITEITD